MFPNPDDDPCRAKMNDAYNVGFEDGRQGAREVASDPAKAQAWREGYAAGFKDAYESKECDR